MKTLARIILGLALTAPLAITSAVRADDQTPPAPTSPDKPSADKPAAGDRKEMTIDQLPKAVKATVQRETKGKKITSITKSTGNSGAAYDIKILDGTKETTICVANDGKVTDRKTGAASMSSSATPPVGNPTDANPPRANSPHATSPSSPPDRSPPPSSPPPTPPSPPSPPPSTDTPSSEKKPDQRANPPGR